MHSEQLHFSAGRFLGDKQAKKLKTPAILSNQSHGFLIHRNLLLLASCVIINRGIGNK